MCIAAEDGSLLIDPLQLSDTGLYECHNEYKVQVTVLPQPGGKMET